MGNIIFPVSYLYVHAWHLTINIRIREKAWIINTSAPVTELLGKKKMFSRETIYPRLPVKCHARSRDTPNQHQHWECCHCTQYLQTLPRFEDDQRGNILAASGHCLSTWKTLPEGLKTLYLFRFELPCLQMSLTGNRPSLLVDKPQVLPWSKQSSAEWKNVVALKLSESYENQDFLFLFSIPPIIHPNARALSNTSELIASIWQVLISSYSFRLSL